MTAVDPLFAQWLQSDGLTTVREDAVLKARWGDTAQILQRQTTFAIRTDAEAEADRQLAFMGQPLVQDEHQVIGRLAPYLGQVVTLTIARLGYDAGIDCFVIGAEDNLATGISKVTVLRRL